MQHQLFIAEGVKTILELLQSDFKLQNLYTTESFNSYANAEVCSKETIITEIDLKRISFLSTPNKALAVFKMSEPKQFEHKGLIVALDAINDPGNLGTIIRLCDWFGVQNLICSNDTVDCYNPKVIQSTMGSIARVNIVYVDLAEFLRNTNLPIFGAFMEGENVYSKKLPNEGILIMGNEANGISKVAEALVTEKISIPQFGEIQETESLNVATATAILLSEFRRGL